MNIENKNGDKADLKKLYKQYIKLFIFAVISGCIFLFLYSKSLSHHDKGEFDGLAFTLALSPFIFAGFVAYLISYILCIIRYFKILIHKVPLLYKIGLTIWTIIPIIFVIIYNSMSNTADINFKQKELSDQKNYLSNYGLFKVDQSTSDNTVNQNTFLKRFSEEIPSLFKKDGNFLKFPGSLVNDGWFAVYSKDASCAGAPVYHLSPQGDYMSVLLKKCDNSGQYYCLGVVGNKDYERNVVLSTKENASEAEALDNSYFCDVQIASSTCPYVNLSLKQKAELDKTKLTDPEAIIKEQKHYLDLFSKFIVNKSYSQKTKTFLRDSLNSNVSASDLCLHPGLASSTFKLNHPYSMIVENKSMTELNFIQRTFQESAVPGKTPDSVFAKKHKEWLCKSISISKDGTFVEKPTLELDSEDSTKFPTCWSSVE